jgi:serine/threonine-protein kinase
MRALEKDPSRRFQDADAFIAALDAAQREPGATVAGTTEFVPAAAVAVPVGEEAAPETVVPTEEEREARRRRNRWIVIALAALAGLLLGFILTRDTPTTDVPAVTGDPLGVAIDRLQNEGFEVADIKRVQRQAPRNQVLEQDPPAADEAEQDCSIFGRFVCSKPDVTLTVSAGPGRAEVPATRGLSQAEATQKLTDAGFDVVTRRANSDTVAVGDVIASDPHAGELARKGSAVELTVSSGPKLISVPAVVGVQRAAAVERIRGRGLTPSVSEQENEAPQGQVISQSPSAGTSVEPGSTISIVVSTGVEKVTVPNVIGDLRPDAVQQLRDAGLSVTVDEQQTDVEQQDGRVTDQFPPPGAEVERGDTVTIQVGEYVAPTPPPTTPTTPSP